MARRVQVKINTDDYDLVSSMSPVLKQTVQAAVADSLVEIQKQWENLAKSKLKSSKDAYINGLSISLSKDALSGSVRLEGNFPLKLELGSEPYDLKPLFESSPKVKHSAKTGDWYMNVPMRQGTPNSNVLSSKLPSSIYNKAKKLPNWGRLKVNSAPEQSWTGYTYTTSKYNDLTKIAIYSSKRSMYMIWRRVSPKSDPLAWIHPGLQGVHLAKEIKPNINSIVTTKVRDYIQEVFGF